MAQQLRNGGVSSGECGTTPSGCDPGLLTTTPYTLTQSHTHTHRHTHTPLGLGRARATCEPWEAAVRAFRPLLSPSPNLCSGTLGPSPPRDHVQPAARRRPAGGAGASGCGHLGRVLQSTPLALWTCLLHLGNKGSLNPEDDLNCNESPLPAGSWGALSPGSARKTHGKRAWRRRGLSGAREGHRVGTRGDLLEAGALQPTAPEDRRAQHRPRAGRVRADRGTRRFPTAGDGARDGAGDGGRGREGLLSTHNIHVHSHSHSHSHSYPRLFTTHTLIQTFIHSHTFTHTHPYTLAHSHTVTDTRTASHTHIHGFSLTRSHMLTHPHTHAHTKATQPQFVYYVGFRLQPHLKKSFCS